MGKGEIARNEQFLLFLQSFLPILRTFNRFHPLQNGSLQTLSVWESLKFVVWKRVKSQDKDMLLVITITLLGWGVNMD